MMARDRYRRVALKEDPPQQSIAWQKAYLRYLHLMRKARWRAAELIARDAARSSGGDDEA